MAAQRPAAVPSAPNKRAAQKARTREKLLASGLFQFDRQGYRATSIEDVAAGAGVSRVAFYLHFASLADLARELVQPAVTELLDHYRRLDLITPTTESLRTWSHGLLRLWQCHAARIRLGEYVVEVEPEIRGLWAAGMDDLASVLPRYVARWEAAAQRPLGVLRLTALLLQHERLCYLFTSSDESAAAAYSESALADLLTEQCWVLLSRQPGRGEPLFGPDQPETNDSNDLDGNDTDGNDTGKALT